jgi:hypothetical protein
MGHTNVRKRWLCEERMAIPHEKAQKNGIRIKSEKYQAFTGPVSAQ